MQASSQKKLHWRPDRCGISRIQRAVTNHGNCTTERLAANRGGCFARWRDWRGPCARSLGGFESRECRLTDENGSLSGFSPKVRTPVYTGYDGGKMTHATAKSTGRRLQPPASRSTRKTAIQQVIDRATDVIGDRDEAVRWIGTPLPALDYATPISLLATSKGKDRVLATLDNLEHGVL